MIGYFVLVFVSVTARKTARSLLGEYGFLEQGAERLLVTSRNYGHPRSSMYCL
jgi:hypothetical protein